MTTYQRRNYTSTEQISVGFKASGKLADAINLAAELAKSPSKASYLMQLVAERVAADLNVPIESLLTPEPEISNAQQEAALQIARLQQTLADAEIALNALRATAAPRRNSVSGFHRKAG